MSRNPPNIPADSGLQRRFNLRGFLAARWMKPESYGTMDVSLEWPLTPQYQANNGVNPQLLAQIILPARPGFHTMVTRFFCQVRGAAAVANDHFELIITQGSNTTAFFLVGSVYFDPARDLGAIYPIIGCFSSDTLANSGYVGMRPVYIPDGGQLRFNLIGDVNTIVAFALEFFQLPSSQPMTTLFNY